MMKSKKAACDCEDCCGPPSYKDVRDNIKNDKRQLMGVFSATEDDFPFSYTIGNHERGLPELLVIGSHTGTYLNEMSERMIAQGKAFDHGEVIETSALMNAPASKKYRIKIINASHKAHEKYTCQVTYYYRTEDYHVQQIILSDEEGRFPDEVGCAPGYANVPVLAAV